MSIISRLFGRSQDETKTCTVCGQEKPPGDFYIKDKHTGRRFSWCKDCHNQRTLDNYYQRTESAREAKRNAPKPTTKQCGHCGEIKPFSAFHRQGEGYKSWCKDCRTIEKADYTNRNRERIRASDAVYREANREAIRERHYQWRQEHPDRWREILSGVRRRRAEQIRAYNQRYRRENAAQYNVYWNARRARKLSNGGSHTVAEWEQCKAYFDYHCLMCGRREPEIRLTKDHVVPINLGGTDDIENIQPLCQRCNSSKSDTIMDLRPDWE